MKLILAQAMRGRIEDEARKAFPRECCGLIEGVREGDMMRVTALYPARNIAVPDDRFDIHPEDHFAALRTARENGRAVIGCYHSHPNGRPVPSASDLAGAGEENFLWLIAGLAGRDAPAVFAAYVYSAALFLPVVSAEELGADLVTSSVKLRN